MTTLLPATTGSIVYKYSNQVRNRYDMNAGRGINNSGFRKVVCDLAHRKDEKKYATYYRESDFITNDSDYNLYDPEVSSINNLCSPAVGDEYYQRSGRQIKVTHFRIKGYIRFIGNLSTEAFFAPLSATLVRMMVFWNNNPFQGASITFSMLSKLQMIEIITGSTFALNFQRVAHFGNYRVIKDTTYALNRNAVTYSPGASLPYAYGGVSIPFDYSIPMKEPVVINFNQVGVADGLLTSIIDNSLHLLATTSASASNYIVCAYNSRATFYET